jgi:hypothetical protein
MQGLNKNQNGCFLIGIFCDLRILFYVDPVSSVPGSSDHSSSKKNHQS